MPLYCIKILDHIIGLLVEVLAKDIFCLSLSFKFSLSFSIYFALIALLSLSSSTVLLFSDFEKGPTVSCFLCIFSSSVSIFISGSTVIFSFCFFPSKIPLDYLNLLFKALTMSSINFPAFYSVSLTCSALS